MKPSDILNAIGGIRDSVVDDAHKVKRVPRKKWLIPTVAAMLVITVTAGALLFPWNNDNNCDNLPLGKHLIAKAEYPEMTQYPEDFTDFETYTKYLNDVGRQLSFHYDGLNINEFIKNSTADILSGEENKVYSPLNVYIALSMLAETTDGNTRRQITDVLGVDSIEKLRDNVKRLWNSTYSDNGVLKTILANSLWLSDEIDYNQGTLDTLASDYYASSYSGKMGDAEYTSELKNWINEQTNGFLSEQVDGIELSPRTILALVSTIYYRGIWKDKFIDVNNYSGTFFGTGTESTVEFMKQSDGISYFESEGFSAVEKSFDGNSSMYFILPDKTTDTSKLMTDDKIYDFLASPDKYQNNDVGTVTISVPKFDVSCDIDLTVPLKQLGITDVFDSSISDFSPLQKEDFGTYLSSASHSSRVKIDEEGCEAAAYTVIEEAGEGIDDREPIEFTLDRPFIFVITSQTGIPLFVGTINQL